ncbi:MAG: type I-C CRISPR-associated protein Cas8c/Csd1 [Nitrospirae bacterium]|nr:type I-C CRISPR-associated protein Cas8c/Csd1 [Nitrospirota bacterium]
MILQALAKYYERMPDDFVPYGFQRKEIPFIIVVDREGNFKSLNTSDRVFLVPREVKRSGKNAWMSANLLWDNEGYVLGYSKKDDDKGQKQNQSFISELKKIFHEPFVDDGIAAVCNFYEKGNQKEALSHPMWHEIEKKGGNISFQLENDNELICCRKTVRDKIISDFLNDPADTQICLVTGSSDIPVDLHIAIKGVWGAQTSGANIVSFNLDAFTSFGKEQGYNAPVGKKAEFAYITMLNYLLERGSRQRIQVGDASTVFWAEKKHELEDWFADIFGEPAKGDSEQDNAAIKALFKAPETGAKPVLNDSTKFYVLGLSPNASRIAIRFWYAGTVAEVEENIRQHFKDIAIEHAPHYPSYLSLFRLLVSTALQGKSDNIQPNLAGDFMRAILAGTPYPDTLLSSAIRRVKAEQEVTYPRASLIKAVLVRKARYKNTKEEIGMALDTDNTNTGYRLGRLFAVLEKIQEEASPGINATIRDRFYSSASSVPVTVFPHLMKLKNHHIAKLENRGRAVNFEKIIGEIVDDISACPAFPGHLSLDDQGCFAVGYYHQRQDFFK